MTYAFERIVEKEKQKGRAAGMAEGRTEGSIYESVRVICNMLEENVAIEIIAKLLRKDVLYIQKVQSMYVAGKKQKDTDIVASITKELLGKEPA